MSDRLIELCATVVNIALASAKLTTLQGRLVRQAEEALRAGEVPAEVAEACCWSVPELVSKVGHQRFVHIDNPHIKAMLSSGAIAVVES